MKILKKIHTLQLPDKEFVVMGSAILEVKNIRKSHDLDIMVSEELFNKFKQNPAWKYTHKTDMTTGNSIDLLEKNDIQLYFSIYGEEDIDYFFADSSRIEEINGIYFSSLEDLLRKKSAWNRPKDQQDIQLIKDYISTY